jgi:hypothetical protein
MITALKSMPYAQACVRTYDDGTMVLQSYTTDVIYIENDWMNVRGLYSATTRRHIGAFMKEVNAKYGTDLCYHNAKACYLGNYELNLVTGEIRECL